MKIATLIVRILLGLVFAVLGSNAFLHFIPMPPLPHTAAGNFVNAIFVSHYFLAIGFCQVVGGLLLLIGRFVPLGLVFLGPVVVNIVCYHLFMDRSGLALALIISLLSLFLLWRYRAAFRGLLRNQGSLG